MSTKRNSTALKIAVALGIGFFILGLYAVPASAAESDACTGNNAITSVSYAVDSESVAALPGNVKPGSVIEVGVGLKPECSTTQIGLAAYMTTGNQWESDQADKQTLAHSNFRKGSGHLRVIAPECFYQIDLFTGKLIGDLGQELYGARLIASDNGGTESCEPTNDGGQVVTHEQPTTTITTPPTTAVPVTVPEDDSIGQFVETPEQIETPIEPVVLAEAETRAPTELAYTGFSLWVLAGLMAWGAASILVGWALTRTARRIS
jgi:hypothetical protein